MFLHIGDSQIVPLHKIVGIFNLGKPDSSFNSDNQQFINKANKHGNEEREDYSSYKSFVVTPERVYFSPISSQTLGKRKIQE